MTIDIHSYIVQFQCSTTTGGVGPFYLESCLDSTLHIWKGTRLVYRIRDCHSRVKRPSLHHTCLWWIMAHAKRRGQRNDPVRQFKYQPNQQNRSKNSPELRDNQLFHYNAVKNLDESSETYWRETCGHTYGILRQIYLRATLSESMWDTHSSSIKTVPHQMDIHNADNRPLRLVP